MNKKRCSKCKEWKDVAEFGRNRSTKDGLRSWCKICTKEFNGWYHNAYSTKRYLNDPVWAKKMKLRRMILALWHGETGHRGNCMAVTIVRLTTESFQQYLKKTYEDRYGESYDGITKVDIDHIIPLCTVDTEPDAKRLCHYTNLQLLKKEDNRKKRTSIDWC